MCRSSGTASALTADHLPDDPLETARITALGGVISPNEGVISPEGTTYLKCTRSLGDAKYKQGPREAHLLCAEPDLFELGITGEPRSS